MKMIKSLCMTIGAALLMTQGIAQAGSVASYFDNDSENWTTSGDVHGFQWVSGIGVPGGSIHGVDDVTGDTWYFIAPAKFLGNQSSAYGQTFSYQINTSARDSAPWTSMPDIAISGNGITLSYFGNFLPTPGVWSSFNVSLGENTGWVVNSAPATQEQIKSVLSNITMLKIRAEYMTGNDNAYLDNVVLNTVPEPASMLSLLAGVLGSAAYTIRRKR